MLVPAVVFEQTIINYNVMLPVIGNTKLKSMSYFINRITAITPLDFLPISRSWELKLTKLAVLINASAQ